MCIILSFFFNNVAAAPQRQYVLLCGNKPNRLGADRTQSGNRNPKRGCHHGALLNLHGKSIIAGACVAPSTQPVDRFMDCQQPGDIVARNLLELAAIWMIFR